MLAVLHVAASTLIRADDPNVQFIGRSRPGPEAGTLEFDMPGCEIRASIVLDTPSCLSVDLAQMHEPHPSCTNCGNTKNSGYEANAFVVWVDGKRRGAGGYNATFVTDVNDALFHSYRLDGSNGTCAAPFAAGTHSVRILKATEADWNAGSPVANYVTFRGFSVSAASVDGGAVDGVAAAYAAAPPPLPTRHIEFLGDSITAGFCNECGASSDPTDHNEAYGATWDHQICELLAAECHTAAWSGLGMVRNCCGGNTTMPSIFEQTLATVTAQGGGTPWDWTKWAADALVINLGTNDGPAVTDPTYNYTETYANLVVAASVHYPNVHVFLACGPMSTHYCDPVHEVIANVTARGVKASFLDQRGFLNGTFGPGCCGHPSIEVDTAMATAGAAFIKTTLGW